MSTKLSVTIDDVCPLIHYSGPWRPGSQINDDYHDQYSDGGTFTITQSTQAFATINFNGTRIQVYGAKRANHNLYTTSLDGQVLTANGQPPPNGDAFRQTLFDSGELNNGPHSLILRDASTSSDPSQSYFDIDWVVIETEVEGGRRIQLDDTDGAFTYGPESAWDAFPPSTTGFSGDTGHSTSSARATATLRFTGSAVDVFGLICPACGQYTVSLDGGSPVVYTSTNSYWTKPQTLLYMGRDLGDGEHLVILTNVANTLNVDYAVIYGTNPAGGPAVGDLTSGTNPAGGSTGEDSTRDRNSSGGYAEGKPTSEVSPQSGSARERGASSGIPVGVIIGAVLVGLAVLILGLAAVLYVRRRTRKQLSDHLHPISPVAESSTILSLSGQTTATVRSFPLVASMAGSSIAGDTPPDYASATLTRGAPVPASPNPKWRKR